MASRRRRSTRSAPSPPHYLWETITINPLAVLSGQVALTDLMPTDSDGGAIKTNRDLVAVRAAGRLTIAPNVFTGFQDLEWAAAIGVAPIPAFNSGSGSLPLAETSSPGWMWTSSGRFIYEGTAGTQTTRNVSVISRAGRAIHGSANLLYLLVKNVSVSAALNLSIDVRILFRLP